MKRDLYEVRRWHVYLHREARGLPLADDLDSRERRVADELFARLYAGELPELAETDRDAASAEWARGVHAAVKAKYDLVKLGDACRGNPDRAAKVVQEVLDSLPQTRSAGGQASSMARDAADGLSNTNLGGGTGYGSSWSAKWRGEEAESERARALADKIRDDERLKKIAMLAGRFKRVASTKQRTRVRRGADEIADVGQGSDVARLLPTELSRLASPRLRLAALRDLYEARCLQYEMESVEELGRGPIVLCVDKSDSMEGDKDVWSTAVALALAENAHRDRRTFIMLGFNDAVSQRIVVKPGRPFPEKALFWKCEGGTDIAKVLDLSLHAAETKTVMRRADIILVSDGASDTRPAPQLRARAAARGVRIYGVGIGVAQESMTPWCDEAVCIEKVDGVDEKTAEILFGK